MGQDREAKVVEAEIVHCFVRTDGVEALLCLQVDPTFVSQIGLRTQFEKEDSPRMTVTPDSWPAEWPPRIGDRVRVTVPTVLSVESR